MDENKNFEDLEPQQYLDIYKDQDAPPDDISQNTSLSLIYYGIGMVCLLIILSLIIKIPKEVSMPFVLKGGEKEWVLQFPQKTYILEKFVQTGQQVNPGDSILKITGPSIVNHIQQYNKTMIKLDHFEEEVSRVEKRKIELLELKIERIKEYIQQTSRRITKTVTTRDNAIKSMSRQIELLEKSYARDTILYLQGVIALADLERSEIAVQQLVSEKIYTEETYTLRLLEQENMLQSFNTQKDDMEVESEEIELRLDLAHKEILSESGQVLTNMKLEFGEFSIQDEALLLMADKKGVVKMISDSESEVKPGEILARFGTAENPYYAYLEASPAQVGQLKKGQKTVLKFASFPHYYFGTVKAEILSVSTSPNEDGFFPIRTILYEDEEFEGEMMNGLTGKSSIILEDKSIFDHMFMIFKEKTTFE